MAVTEQDVIEGLLAAATTIGPIPNEQKTDGGYGQAGVIAHHVVSLMSNGSESELRRISQTVEAILSEERTSAATNLVTVGLLEDLQNITLHSEIGVPSSAFVPYLGPNTADAWWRLHETWGSEDT